MTPSYWLPNSSASTPGLLPGGVFSFEVVEIRPGIAVLQITGPDASQVFANESGGHRWQRVPPTEKRGRVQTSTITVATFEEVAPHQVKISPTDLEWETMRSSGAGGQNVNKLETAVRVRHKPSGLVVRCETERSQKRNKDIALSILAGRLKALEENKRSSSEAQDRRQQIGSGQRGDKRRTVREKDGQVNDHILGKRWNYSDYVKGIW